MINRPFFIRWKKAFQELIGFLKRDIQDDHWADYRTLSVEARRTLLLIGMVILVTLFFIVWRYFWGDVLLQQYQEQQTTLSQKEKWISKDIAEREYFLESDVVVFFQKQQAFDNRQTAVVSEIALMQLLESTLRDLQLNVVSILPQKMQRILELSKNRNNIRGNKPLYQSQTSVLSHLKPIISESLLLGDNSEDLVIPMLEITLNLCGEYHSLLLFLESIAQSLSHTATLFYLEQLTVNERPRAHCFKEHADNNESLQNFDVKLQFYDFLALQSALIVAQKQAESHEALALIPTSLPALSQVLQHIRALNTPNELNIIDMNNIDNSMRSLFQEDFQSLMPSSDPYLSSNTSENKRYWMIGESYQGAYLAGIILQDQEFFAIIQDKNGGWQSWKVGENGILTITPQYLELDLP